MTYKLLLILTKFKEQIFCLGGWQLTNLFILPKNSL